MGKYFHGWRRKIGLVTLLLACVFVAGWVRSIFVHDVLLFWDGTQALGLWGSQSGSLVWDTNDNPDVQRWTTPRWQNWIASEGVHPFDNPEIKWQWRFCGFGFASDGMTSRIVPYWAIVIPLTLLAAWLLLSKPRPLKSATSSTKELSHHLEGPR